MTASRAPDRHSLDAVGRLHYAVHEALRDLGYAGFVCQLHVWLGGRIDADLLRRALGNLGRRYPLLTARIVREKGRRGAIYWEPRPEAACPLSVVDVDSSEEAAVHRHAESLMARPFDLAEGEPIGFHLLRRPDGRDVLIVNYDHTLIGDAQAATLLLEELDALAAAPADAVQPAGLEVNEVESYLRSYRRWTRLVKAIRLVAANIKPRAALKLMRDGEAAPVYDACRIAVRVLDQERSDAFAHRVRRACGFPNLSLALLASGFRALHRASGSPTGGHQRVATGVGYSLRPPAPGALFRTFGSEMILSAELDELGDRDDLTRLLVKRAREQIRRGLDLGGMQLARVGGQYLALVRRGFKRRMKDMSFSFGYFKPVDESGSGLFGVSVEHGYHLIMPWSPPGLTVSANLCRGRLHVTVTSGVETVPAPAATDFLEALVDDLVA